MTKKDIKDLKVSDKLRIVKDYLTDENIFDDKEYTIRELLEDLDTEIEEALIKELKEGDLNNFLNTFNNRCFVHKNINNNNITSVYKILDGQNSISVLIFWSDNSEKNIVYKPKFNVPLSIFLYDKFTLELKENVKEITLKQFETIERQTITTLNSFNTFNKWIN